MATNLLDRRGRFDRAAIMRNAHKRHRDGRRLGLGWTFGQCLATAWQAAKMQREGVTATAAPYCCLIATRSDETDSVMTVQLHLQRYFEQVDSV